VADTLKPSSSAISSGSDARDLGLTPSPTAAVVSDDDGSEGGGDDVDGGATPAPSSSETSDTGSLGIVTAANGAAAATGRRGAIMYGCFVGLVGGWAIVAGV